MDGGNNGRVVWNESISTSWFQGNTALSLSIWIKPLVKENTDKKIFLDWSGSIISLEGRIGTGQQVEFSTNNDAPSMITTPLVLGAWTHVALVLDGTNTN